MSNDKENKKKKVTWIIDPMVRENTIILMAEDDPRGFVHTNKTPKEIDDIIKRYIISERKTKNE